MRLSLVSNLIRTSRWATMIELMAMLAIVGLGIWSMFSVITSGIYFAKDTEDTIKAINLAREWIEWVTNIRNTNWLRFSSDRTNCWKSLGYDSFCIGSTTLWDKIWTGSYVLNTSNWLWHLSGTTIINPTTDWATYSNTYFTIQDPAGFSNQTGSVNLPVCTNTIQKTCKSIFTREIQIVPDGDNTLYVKSIVRWNNKWIRTIELQTTLTNWKSKF